MKKQLEMEQVEKTELGICAQNFVMQRQKIKEEREELKRIGEKVIEAMKNENRDVVVISVDNESWRFEVSEGQDKLKCSKKNPLN